MLTSKLLLLLPAIIFLVLIFMGREELGIKWVLILIAIVAALAIGVAKFGLPQYPFIGVLALVDIILVIVIFKGAV
ncbi:MAG: hypothetical protein ACYTEL_07015 [Planctomycetota bacterium]|jgi:hypothetical protein